DAVSFWSGSVIDPAPESVWMNRLAEGCTAICDYAATRGIRLAFEPEPGMAIDTMERFARLHEQVNRPNFGLTLDIGHLQCQGELPIGDHIRKWRDLIWNVHIEDMKRGIHDHLMFGEGDIDFAEVFTVLKEIQYAGGVHVELSRHSHNAVEIARQSLEYLRSHLSVTSPDS
ncbi:MAG: sugar phosphate isomerase/epimerase family protein, partial [Candidatus Acidiferrum sp.]